MDYWWARPRRGSRIREDVKQYPLRAAIFATGMLILWGPHGYVSTHHTIYIADTKDDHLYDNDYDMYHELYSRAVVLYVCACAAVYSVKGDDWPRTMRSVHTAGRVVVAIGLAFILTFGVYVVKLTECSFSEKTGFALWTIVPHVLMSI